MFYLLHGDDEFTIREKVKKIRQQGNFEYTQDTYNGGEIALAPITATCDTLPFLTDQRLVVVEGLPKKRRGETSVSATGNENAQLGEEGATNRAPTTAKASKVKKSKKSGKGSTESRAGFEKALTNYIPHLPDFCVLIVLVDEVLDASNPLLKTAGQYGQVIQCMLPKGAALESWITKRAKSIGVSISPDAAALLANFIGNH